MKVRKKGFSGLMLAVVLVLGALLGACGTDQPTGVAVQTRAGVVIAGAATVGLNTCTSCHSVQTSAWLASKHANVSPAGNLDSAGSPATGYAGHTPVSDCTPCHDPLGDSGRLADGYTGNTIRPVVGCESCHGGGSLHVAQGGVGPIGYATLQSAVIGSSTTSTLPVSAQFRTCTSCHELLLLSNPAGTTPATAAHNAGGIDPRTTAQSITDTHFAKSPYSGTGSLPSPYTTAGVTAVIGYSMDYASERVCIDCHNPHGNTIINQEWAQSAHADRYGTNTRYFSAAWARNNWSTRTTCQRCHTTTGFAAYADAFRNGDSSRAESIRLGTLVTMPSVTLWKPEMLKCNGCHTDYKGTVRNPGAVTANYDYTSGANIYAKVSYVYPDAGSSNICLLCHTARESGETVKGLNNADLLSSGTISVFDFSNTGLITSHYLTGGGTVYTATGYEYDGRSYENNSSYRHDKIGTPAAPNTGSSGPCAGCHMSRPNKNGNHLYLPITRSALTATASVDRSFTTITGIASQVCINCHGPNDPVFIDLVTEQKMQFEDSLEALTAAMELAGLYGRGTSFYRARDLRVISAGTATILTGNTAVLGLRTNWQSVGLDPGDTFRIDNDGTFYTIASVVSGTQITLSSAFTGTNYSSANYTIVKNEVVSVATGTTAVTGTGTNWNTGLIAPGDKFRIDSNGSWYTIASVATDTQIALTSPYAGPSTTTTEFTLRNNTTASVATSSPTVTVAGANLITLDVSIPTATSATSAGDYFRIDSDGTWYKINNRTATTLTLASGFTGTAVSGAAYTIIQTNANRNWLTRGDVDTSGNMSGRNTMGAAFNFYLLDHDPAAYVHNRYYVKRLIYDSIDWLDDNSMNNSVGATLSAICSGVSMPAWCPRAMTYVLPNGVLGIAAERP